MNFFPNSGHKKFLLSELYHRAKFKIITSSITRVFMSCLRFFKIWEANFRDEPGAEEVRDGPMVSLAKMILMSNTFTVSNMKSNFWVSDN